MCRNFATLSKCKLNLVSDFVTNFIECVKQYGCEGLQNVCMQSGNVYSKVKPGLAKILLSKRRTPDINFKN